MKIYYKKVRPDEVAFTPVKREMDADFDLFSSIETIVKPKEITIINTNIAIEFPANYEGKIENKSGLSAKGLLVLGGVIDHMYTGEILVIVTNLGKNIFHFKPGNKIAQLKLRERTLP